MTFEQKMWGLFEEILKTWREFGRLGVGIIKMIL